MVKPRRICMPCNMISDSSCSITICRMQLWAHAKYHHCSVTDISTSCLKPQTLRMPLVRKVYLDLVVANVCQRSAGKPGLEGCLQILLAADVMPGHCRSQQRMRKRRKPESLPPERRRLPRTGTTDCRHIQHSLQHSMGVRALHDENANANLQSPALS